MVLVIYEHAHRPMTGTLKKVRVPDLALMKQRSERIVMLTAYDATMARLLDQAGIDLLLVGDSLGHVILGLDSTIPVTLDAVVHHTALWHTVHAGRSSLRTCRF